MKKIAAMMSLLLIISALSINADAVDTPSLLIMGDSISTGYGLPYAGTTRCDSYGNLLSQKLSVAESDFTNAAVNGYTSSDMNILIDTMDETIADADIIVFSIGGNDVLSSLIGTIIISMGGDISEGLAGIAGTVSGEGVDLEALHSYAEEYLSNEKLIKQFNSKVASYRYNYGLICSKLRELNPEALIVAQTLYNPIDNYPEFEICVPFTADVLGNMNDVTLEVSAEYDIFVADVSTAFSGHGTEYSNIKSADIHPNADGHKIIYETVAAVIDANASAIPSGDRTTEASEEPQTTAAVTDETTTAETTSADDITTAETTETGETAETEASETNVGAEPGSTGPIVIIAVLASVFIIGIIAAVTIKKKK